MADKFQESLMQAIDYLVSSRIDAINKDVTITAVVNKCRNALENSYEIQYNGGFLIAYAQEGASYSQNQSVYVLVPEGDFSKKKIIIGKASQVTEDSNISFVSSLLESYNLIGQNTITDTNNIQPTGLHSYLKEEYKLLYQRNEQNENFVQFNEDEFNNYIKEADALMIEGSFMTRLPKAHRLNKKGVYGVQFLLAFKDKDKPEEIKYVSYTIDSTHMTGNPLLYNNYTDQYAIFPIDTENFLYLESIMVYEQGFVDNSDNTQAEFWGPDIFIKELEIYGLRKLGAKDGDYLLRLMTPQGATFKTIMANEELTCIAQTMYQVSTDVSDSTTYYWFAKDDRITPTSEYYHMYGGSGWKLLKDKGANKTFVSNGSENRAYENIYMAVAVYKEQIILKDEFILYNEAAKRDISIESDLGTKFSFDRGKPVLTCLVNGKSSDFEDNHADELFSFSWAKIDEYGNNQPLNQTYEELEAAYQEGLANGLGYSELAALKNQMLMMQDVEFDRNILKYPVKQITSKATFSCSVYLKETSTAEDYFIGNATITLQNENVASPTDYYILIENGNQVFQYSESGVSPANERYQDPLEIKPLECHFYDPAGLEVNKDTYTVKWKVPLTDTMLQTPSEGMEINPANGKIEWFTQEIFPTKIKESYDYQALNNQVTCIITYNGQEYQQDSDFLFTKIGENGTNGTDVVAKISPVLQPNKGLLAIEVKDGIGNWNNGDSLVKQGLKFELYKRNELLNITSSTWSMAGGNSRSKNLSVTNGIISYFNSDTGNYNQIVKATTSFEGQNYYAFYPVPIIDYHAAIQSSQELVILDDYSVILDKTKTLKSITYNADGRNPLYNKNQGVFFTLDFASNPSDKWVVWEAIGGISDAQDSAAFTLSFEKNATKGYHILSGSVSDSGEYGVYILPNDVYDGAWCNNLVHATIYSSEQVANDKGNPETDIWIPIHMSLNTFGLASLNAWDGNHVEINEDENYILAPQIGAGIKDNNNKFTGIVMGKAQTYDMDDVSVGLLGYSEGKQSIWLDAESGKAVFGLPEEQASANNHYTEGRIELVPGGDSKIGNWTIGSRAIYNMTEPIIENGIFKGVQPDKPYKDYPVKDAQMSIPYNAQGMILNANPAYLSVKSMPLDETNSNIDWQGANTALKRGDALEVELDPRKSSLFSIYRHTKFSEGNTSDTPDLDEARRYPIVGINANGQFYTNAIEDGESSMGIGKIGAFGTSAADGLYMGAQFAYKGSNIFKFFIPEDDTSVLTRPVYLTAGTNKDNEYARPFYINANNFAVYTDENKNTTTVSDHYIQLDNSIMKVGHSTDNYLQIGSLASKKPLELKTTNDAEFAFSGTQTTITNKNKMSFTTKTLDVKIDSGNKSLQAVNGTIVGNINFTGFNDLTLKSAAFSDTDKNYTLAIGSNVNNSAQGYFGNNHVFIALNDSLQSTLYATSGMIIQTVNNGLNLRSDSSEGIKLDAYFKDNAGARPYLHLIPQSGGTGDYILSSGHGTVQSKNDLGNNRAGVQITPGIGTSWGYFTGTIQGSNDTIAAEKDIRSVNGWCYGGNFAFNTNKGWNAHGGNYTSTSLEQHLAWLYSLVNSAYARADDAWTRANNAQTAANNANANANTRAPMSELTSFRDLYGRHSHTVTVDNGHRETAPAGIPEHSHDFYINLTTNSSKPQYV